MGAGLVGPNSTKREQWEQCVLHSEEHTTVAPESATLFSETWLGVKDTMDVPFTSSGAMSRAHYGLVRRVETATSMQDADQILLSEIIGIRGSLQNPRLSLVRRAPTPFYSECFKIVP